jgi:hypothetical protein
MIMTFEAAQADIRKRRAETIESLIEESRAKGGITDRLYWTMVYDFEMAPVTTNREQLAALGIHMPPLTDVPPNQKTRILKEVVGGLAKHNIYVCHADCFDDDALYERLFKCLDEKVREMVVQDGVKEYLELNIRHDAESKYPRPWIPSPSPLPVGGEGEDGTERT